MSQLAQGNLAVEIPALGRRDEIGAMATAVDTFRNAGLEKERMEAEAEVRRAIAPERLLAFDVAEGWAPLCRFLGAEIPKTPFPGTA